MDFDRVLIGELYRLLFLENRSISDTLSYLRSHGYSGLVRSDVQYFRRNALKVMNDSSVRDSLLENFDRIRDDFNYLVLKIKGIIERAESSGDDRLQLQALGELRSSLQLALKRLGELTDRVVKVDGPVINGNVNIVQSFNLALYRIFNEMGAREENGKIVIHRPTPEFLLDFRNNSGKLGRSSDSLSNSKSKKILLEKK